MKKTGAVVNRHRAAFGRTLKQARDHVGLSLRELEKVSGVPNSHISAMETGHRTCGTRAAGKLASALFPHKDQASESMAFRYAAALTVNIAGVVDADQFAHPAILNAVAAKLRKLKLGDVDRVEVPRGTETHEPDLRVVLRDGSAVDVNIKIERKR